MRRPSSTVVITAATKASVTGSRVSPSSGTAASMDTKGWISCTWLTRRAPPQASPRYQAKKPSHIETSAR